MMKSTTESKVLLLSLALSIIGIAAIYFYSKSLTPKEFKISELKFLSEGTYIATKGIVKNVRANTLTTLTLCDFEDLSECIEVRYFFDYHIEKGESLLVFGIVKEWSGKTYIEVKTRDEITKI
jgi:DNA/RNA endonuclease YhcR with UshA esterase domain